MIENTFPRPVSEKALKGEWPRPACIHDPTGELATCDICGPRDGEVYNAYVHRDRQGKAIAMCPSPQDGRSPETGRLVYLDDNKQRWEFNE
jgi:hypothetical protein